MPLPPIIPDRRRAVAAVGLTGALLVPAAPALGLGDVLSDPAQGVEELCGELAAALAALDPACAATGAVGDAVAPALGPVQEALAPVTAPVEDALAPVTAPVEEALAPVTGAVEDVVTPAAEAVQDVAAPVTDALPTDPAADQAADPDQAPAAPVGDADGIPAAGGDGAAPPEDDGPKDVEAAGGKAPEEVVEPQAPAAADGRVAGAPTIQPAMISRHTPTTSSQSGLTLQPYESPLVSVPGDVESPQVAGAPVTTAGPVAAIARDAMDFAGDVALDYTSGAAGWITATGLGLMAAAGVAVRRRVDGLQNAVLDD